MGSGFFGLFDRVFPLMFGVGFALILGVFLYVLIKNIQEWHHNNNSPRLTVEATVVAKRENVNVRHTPVAGAAGVAHGYTASSSTDYYATFEVESGDRMEFSVSGTEYGQLAEGDRGKLSFQGTRFLGFLRRSDPAEQ